MADVRAALADEGAGVEVIAVESLCDGPGAVDEARLGRAAERLRRGGERPSGGQRRGGTEPPSGEEPRDGTEPPCGEERRDGTEPPSREPVDRVIVAGGDGSVGAAAALAARLGVPLAVIPTGTANDLARFLGLPLDVAGAAKLAARRSARTTSVELATAAGRRPFVNAASAGLSVLAARRARPLKPRLGRLAYAVGALRAGIAGRPLHLAVRCDGRTAFQGRAWQVVVGATGAFGGGSGTGGVDPHDHRLDVAIVEAGSRPALIRRAWAMRNQRLVDDPGVRHVRGRAVEIEGARKFNVDGELVTVEPARFEVAGSIEVVVP
ncbi:MAG TPA: diacylglycerol kinase family protein [Solirubrobacteraceae bacterium]|nr:diacylglycerol kinase family protein [Solirubrobacteraceae bacterium]